MRKPITSEAVPLQNIIYFMDFQFSQADAIKGKNNIMAIIIALHYCCVMRIFLMPHKVRIFLQGDAGNFVHATQAEIR